MTPSKAMSTANTPSNSRTKKRKVESTGDAPTKLKQLENDLQNKLKPLDELLELAHPSVNLCKSDLEKAKLSSSLKLWQMFLNDTSDRRAANLAFKVKLKVPEGLRGDVDVGAILGMVREAMNDIETAYNAVANYRMSPSSFATNWAESQARYDDLLCMRPTERSSIPIYTFHSAFQRYLKLLKDPVPQDSSGDAAHRAAHVLCMSMGDSFKNERERSITFNQCIQDLFPVWEERSYFQSKTGSPAFVDFTLREKYGAFYAMHKLIIREDRKEPGAEGDPYMQCSRDYQIYVDILKETSTSKTWVSLGAPIFLLSIYGPLFCVAGGFYDGKSCIVEPLGSPLWMLKDAGGSREEQLTRTLYALHQGMVELAESENKSSCQTPVPCYLPGVPRVYPPESFKPFGFIESPPGIEDVLYQSKLVAISSRHPYFEGQVQNQKILTKMLPAQTRYGETVHLALASKGYAPALYGAFRHQDYPVLYVMEHLSDWVTLDRFAQETLYGGNYGHLLAGIRVVLDEIIDFLEEKGYVHGDLRAGNIMIQVEDTEPPRPKDGVVKLKLVDFDWAGEYGKVMYPPQRNIQEIKWPEPEEGNSSLIGKQHDRMLVDIWWPTFGQPDL